MGRRDASAGFALTRLVDEPSRRRLAARVAALWPPGPYALAAAAAIVIEAMAGRSRRMASCFVAPDAGRRCRHARACRTGVGHDETARRSPRSTGHRFDDFAAAARERVGPRRPQRGDPRRERAPRPARRADA